MCILFTLTHFDPHRRSVWGPGFFFGGGGTLAHHKVTVMVAEPDTLLMGTSAPCVGLDVVITGNCVSGLYTSTGAGWRCDQLKNKIYG